MHTLVGLGQPQGIYLAKPHKLGERPEDRFHRALPFAFHIPAQRAVYPGNVAFVFLAVGSDVDPLFVGLADALGLDGTALAIAASGEIVVLERSFFAFLLAEGHLFPLLAQPVISFFDICKTVRPSLIGAVGRDKAFDILSFKERIILPTAVAKCRPHSFPTTDLVSKDGVLAAVQCRAIVGCPFHLRGRPGYR